jgi:nitrite reductase/ring-hydroxylating ferredoxin subunit
MSAQVEHVVALVTELQPGDHKIVTIGRLTIGLFRIGDDYHALPNICPHQYGPLCAGGVGGAVKADASTGWQPTWRYEGEVVTCPWHGLEVHVTTGHCLAYPKIRLRKYRVKIEADEVRVVLH